MGSIRYGDEIVIVLESKLDGRADDLQACNINLNGQPISFDGPVRKISWRDVLAAFADLANEDRGLTSGAELALLSDFLTFVDANFPQLGPFSNLQRCGGEPSRVNRRLETILREALGGDGNMLPGTHAVVLTAYLVYEDRQVKLNMYPADTLQQARVFYDRLGVSERILSLVNTGWGILPNFHFGFMAKGFCWTTATLPLASYLSYWRKNIASAKQIDRERWDAYWAELEKEKIAEPTDRDQFDYYFTQTGRRSASPRPGIACTLAWEIHEAEHLDVAGQFTKAVRDRINQMLEALGEEKIGSS